ncbi:hypothetical protein B0H14DRAFT_3681401 [Mycena olivaceomarginata]|nr:hypothetical protein B0H14DRAFT_3681401 [Mycena olivaceomarginata]
MFSRSYHHDQMAPGHIPTPPTHFQTPKPADGGWPPSTDRISAHHDRLESLLDSALATMTLILDIATTPTFSAHTTDVLRALCQRTIVATCPSPNPDPNPLPHASTIPSTPTKIATYAGAVTATPDHTGTGADEASMTKAAKRDRAQSSASSAPDLIFRIDSLPSAPTVRPHPTALFPALAAKPVTPDLCVAGVRWTQNGNLTINFTRTSTYTADGAMEHAPAIWGIIRPHLRLPKHCPIPRIDRGGPWHSVLVHDVPVLPLPGEPGYDPDPVNLHQWLHKGGFCGQIEHVSILCSDEALLSRKTVPFRLSLASRADAEFLVKNGALLFGSRCRVSHYVAKPRTRPPCSDA